MKKLVLSTVMILAIFANSVEANVLVNPGFESPPVSPEAPGAAGWSPFGGVFTIDSSITPAHSGDQSLKVFGVAGVFQDFAASPGQLWDAGAWVLNDGTDPMVGGQVAAVNIEWHGAGGFIDFITNGDTTSATTPDVWIERPVSGVAPAGTTTARIVLITGDFGEGAGGGAPKFDDAFLRSAQFRNQLALHWLAWVSLACLSRRADDVLRPANG